MSDSNYRTSPKEVRRLVLGELSPSEATRVRRAVAENAEFQQVYERLVRAERALEGDAEAGGLGAGAKARVSSRLFAVGPAPRRWALWNGWPMMMAATAALVAVVAVVPALDQEAVTEEHTYSPRGPGPTLSADRVLQVLRVTVGPEGQVQVAPADQLASADQLRFAAFVREGTWKVSVLAVRVDGRRKVLSSHRRVVGRPAAQRLDAAFTVPEDWRGPVQFVGVFEQGEAVDLTTLDLKARDESGLSVRVVRATVGGVD